MAHQNTPPETVTQTLVSHASCAVVLGTTQHIPVCASDPASRAIKAVWRNEVGPTPHPASQAAS